MTVRALIAEDEPLLAARLKEALAQAWPELEIAGVAATGDEALALAERLRPELAFLDIRLPGLSGLEVAEELAERLGEAVPAIVFVTAYDEHALEAFELAAADYLLKPLEEARLAVTVARLKERLGAGGALEKLAAQLRAALAPRAGAEPLREVRASSGNAVKLIPIGEVCYFQAADKYTSVVTPEGESLIRTPLRELEPRLPERFRRIHRGTIVNLDEVAAAVRDESGRVALRLRRRKETLPVSRVFAELFRAM